MLSGGVGEGEEVFFDTSDQFLVVKEDLLCHSNVSDYDIWLREPTSVRERRELFLSKMGFIESETTLSVATDDDHLLSERRKSNSEANCSVDYSDRDWSDNISIDMEEEEEEEEEEDGEINENLVQCDIKGETPSVEEKNKKKAIQWWRNLTRKIKKNNHESNGPKLCGEAGLVSRVRVEHNKKRFVECSSVYTGQEIKAHDGLIWTMKFSPDGQYLASGGEDRVVCVWRVTMVGPSCKNDIEGESSPIKKKVNHASVIVPERTFHIEDEPVHKFHGHTSDVLDLAWSTSNHLLSSSMDETVRLWQVGSDKCLGVYHHNNYVTCVQFNPADESYFISGSIDGKVRIWGIPRRRVEDWANVTDIVTSVCYQPNGNGFVVGSVSGTCRFYELSGDGLLLNAEINIRGRTKSPGNKITGIQFLKNDSRRVMITSEDSKIRILDGLEVVCKYKGLTKSGSQMSASFTSIGKHIVSVGEDSRVYLWNYDHDLCIQTSKQAKSTRSCEHFLSEGVTVALPWSDSDNIVQDNKCSSSPSRASTRVWEPERFSLANWFSMDGSSRASITWPEERLPQWDLQSVDDHDSHHLKNDGHGSRIPCITWGLVFVTAHWDGTIRTFHNYGLPVRI